MRKQLIQALWDAYYHMELQDLDQIHSNDHPRLLKLAADIERRLGYESVALCATPPDPARSLEEIETDLDQIFGYAAVVRGFDEVTVDGILYFSDLDKAILLLTELRDWSLGDRAKVSREVPDA